MKNIYNKTKSILWQLIIKLISIGFIQKKIIICECFMFRQNGKFQKNNWGDDLNKYFFEFITDKYVINIPFTSINKEIPNNIKCFSMIGSILNFYNLDNKIIYGSGIIDPLTPINGKPRRIISVRGPKTRDVLNEHGILCPASYGDPALMLPLFYKPRLTNNKKRVVVIPNMGSDYELYSIKIIQEHYDAVLLDLKKYNNWTDVIDVIANSKFVISESLHGIIVAETYNIPNVWVEFVEHPSYWNFKFEDFYESIIKEGMSSIKLYLNIDFCSIDKAITTWKKGIINYNELRNQIPF